MTYRVPDNVAHVDGTNLKVDDAVYVTRLPSGHTVRLAGTAGLIWREVVAGRDPLPGTARALSLPEESVETEVSDFVARLVSQGLLVGLDGP